LLPGSIGASFGLGNRFLGLGLRGIRPGLVLQMELVGVAIR